MSFEIDIERCGGLRPVASSDFNGVSNQELLDIQASVGFDIPVAYKQFITMYGACTFNNLITYPFKKQNPIYIHPKKMGFNQPKIKSGMLSHFYGSSTKKCSHLQLKTIFKSYQHRIPQNFLPISNDGMGNQICIGINTKNDLASIYFWDHENEWDEDDYFDETGNEMPIDAKFQNVYLIADSFSHFFSKLQVLEK